MSTEHTPGPWTISADIIMDKDQNAVAYIGQGAPADELDGNARLIAAAPELLEALQAFVARYPGNIGAEKAREIIAKATGSNP